MNLQQVQDLIIRPAHILLPGKMYGNDATTMLLAIGLQESRFQYRRQIMGPARGFWQFELGGVDGVLSHHASKHHAGRIIGILNYPHARKVIQEALADNDILAAIFARLLLWTDPDPIPTTADEAWDYYLRNWRPGKPHPEMWSDFWTQATQAVQYATRRVEVQQ